MKEILVDTKSYSWKKLESGVMGLFEGDSWTGHTGMSEYSSHAISYFTGGTEVENPLESLKAYARELKLEVEKPEIVNATSSGSQRWYCYNLIPMKMELVKFQCPIEKDVFTFFYTNAPIEEIQETCLLIDQRKESGEQIENEYELVQSLLVADGYSVEKCEYAEITF